jgi:membrane-associated protease RseP (regulator of RpoE activity)
VATLTKDPQSQEIQAAWKRYVVLLAGAGLVFLIATVVVWPWPYALAVEQFMLPQYEAAFGFRGGRLPLSTGDSRQTIYGFVAVVPGGRLALAGAKSGDIPVEYHGGIWAFYGALLKASSGSEAAFDVLAHSEWPDWDKRRKIVLTPEQAPPR